VSQEDTNALNPKFVKLPANNLGSVPFDLNFGKELFNNATTTETKWMSM
jgi:hypothetical protein